MMPRDRRAGSRPFQFQKFADYSHADGIRRDSRDERSQDNSRRKRNVRRRSSDFSREILFGRPELDYSFRRLPSSRITWPPHRRRREHVTIDNAPVTIAARIVQIDGFSAHKDSDHLLEFVSHSQKTLKKVFVCMGEPSSETFLAQKIRDNLNIDAVVPEEGSSADLI